MEEYTFTDFANEIEKRWWEKRKKEFKKLSNQLDIDLFELIPNDLRDRLVHPHQETPSADSSFLIKHSLGDGKYKVCVDSKILKSFEKSNRNKKDELLGIIEHLSKDKTGQTLPNAHNDNYLKRINKSKRVQNNLKKIYTSNVDGKSLIVQYRPSKKIRILWEYSTSDDKVYILDVNTRSSLDKLLWN